MSVHDVVNHRNLTLITKSMKPNYPMQFLLPLFRQRSIQIVGLSLTLALAGCSSVKSSVNKGAVTARTFSFLNSGARQMPNASRKQAHELVQQALINNLSRKGVSYTATGGDVSVAYLIVVGNNGATTSLNEYFGYTDDSAAMVDKVHSAQTGGDNRDYVEAGTLVIDIMDPGTSKILQRRSVHSQVLRNLTRESRAARVQSLVDNALKDVPFSSNAAASR